MLPLTDKTLRYITHRLGPTFTKHTWTSIICWEPKASKFILTSKLNGYRTCNTYLVYYFGNFVLFGFIAFTYFLSNASPDIYDTSPGPSDTLLTFSMLLYITAMSGIIGFGVVLLEYQEECAETFNYSVSLDAHFKSTIPVKISSEEAKYSELLAKLICYPPLVVPFVFGLTLFHPLDPVHIFLERVLEVKVAFNRHVFLFSCIEFYGVTCFMAAVTIVLLMGFLPTLVTVYWLETAMPVNITPSYKGKHTIYGVNKRKLEENKVIWVYRSLQCLVAITNRIVTHPFYVAHAIAMLMIWVISAFVLIRYNDTMLDGSAMGLTLVGIFVAATIIGSGVYFMECLLFDYMEDKWTSYKRVILTQAGRKSILYKAAKSFRPVTLHLGGMFYNINNSTYLEWIEAGIDNLTTLLCSF